MIEDNRLTLGDDVTVECRETDSSEERVSTSKLYLGGDVVIDQS